MEGSLRKIFEDHDSLLHFLTEVGMAVPPALAATASFAINASLRNALEAENFDPSDIESILSHADADHVELDTQLFNYTAGQRMKRAMIRLEAAASGGANDPGALPGALTIANTIRDMPFEVSIWQAQNIWNDLLRRSDTNYWAPEWKQDYKKLGQAMNISVDELVVEEGVSAF
jgi:hypothetical protein